MNVIIIITGFIICCFCKSYAHNRAAIAIAAQGKAADLANWIKMESLMKMEKFSALFVLSYDLPINKSLCDNKVKVTCLFYPGSTWRSGRNVLIRSIAKYEENVNHHFKYWLFGDDDAIKIKSCYGVLSTNKSSTSISLRSLTIEMAAFCFD